MKQFIKRWIEKIFIIGFVTLSYLLLYDYVNLHIIWHHDLLLGLIQLVYLFIAYSVAIMSNTFFENKITKLFLDDERQAPEGWYHTKSVEATIAFLMTRQITHLSLDNDLGDSMREGYEVLNWLEEEVYNDHSFPMPEITIHSANPVRVKYMQQVAHSIELIRQQQVGGS